MLPIHAGFKSFLCLSLLLFFLDIRIFSSAYATPRFIEPSLTLIQVIDRRSSVRDMTASKARKVFSSQAGTKTRLKILMDFALSELGEESKIFLRQVAMNSEFSTIVRQVAFFVLLESGILVEKPDLFGPVVLALVKLDDFPQLYRNQLIALNSETVQNGRGKLYVKEAIHRAGQYQHDNFFLTAGGSYGSHLKLAAEISLVSHFAIASEIYKLGRGYGLALGGNDKIQYLEAEIYDHQYVFGLGIGPNYQDNTWGWQATLSFPLLPLIPYLRWYQVGADFNREIGIMYKQPFRL